jgi:GH15 family glucan-1,4-alpha-glucosidase
MTCDEPPPQRTLIEDHGLVGDLRSAAVIDISGAVSWLCWPRFDSPSIFGSLLDPQGGHWSIRPAHDADGYEDGRQTYLSGTNVLITRFHTSTGLVEVEDFMTLDTEHRQLVRRVHCLRGEVTMQMRCHPRPDYARAEATLRARDDGCATIATPDYDLELASTTELGVDDHTIAADFDVREGDVVDFALGEPGGSLAGDCGLARTIDWWKRWTAQSEYRGRWRQAVERSALALKLLTHAPTGGIVAAATTSVPETLGGERNWDYRYVWIRDAAFTLYALLRLGHQQEAKDFTGWLLRRLQDCEGRDDPPLSPLYDLDGNDRIAEEELDHWAGYGGSRPVRVGNAASSQRQLDVYGELIDSLYLADKYGAGLSLDEWTQVRRLVEYVIDHWHEPDDGMWEARLEPAHHTSSLLMCWVAVERAMRMAHSRGRPAPLERWRAGRDEIHATLLERGWNAELGAFTRILDGDDLDASILLAPLVKFLPATDPRWTSTMAALEEHLAHGPLVDRYATHDGLDGDEGSFTICSFWYVEALARAGEVERARHLFDRLLSYGGPLGLFSEEIGADGHQLGNFPQAFTHLALISAAYQLDEALDAAT